MEDIPFLLSEAPSPLVTPGFSELSPDPPTFGRVTSKSNTIPEQLATGLTVRGSQGYLEFHRSFFSFSREYTSFQTSKMTADEPATPPYSIKDKENAAACAARARLLD